MKFEQIYYQSNGAAMAARSHSKLCGIAEVDHSHMIMDRGRDAHCWTPPRTEPSGPDSGTRLPPWVSDDKASIRPGMKDTRQWQERVRQLCDAFSRGAVFLAAAI
jgi:hypothetical protein